MLRITIALALLAAVSTTTAQGRKPIKLTAAWKERITKTAPSKATVTPEAKRKVLIFSLMTGFKHWVTPHTTEIVRIIGKKTGAYDVVKSTDINMFSVENLKQFDAVFLNNTCSKGPRRNMFLDALGKGKEDEAAALEKNLIDFIASGKGLVALHGAITFLNGSEGFGEVIGGAFDFHPRQQKIVATPVDPDHPLVKAFAGKAFVHVDEPYIFKGAYAQKNFRPLLVMDTDKLRCGKRDKKVRSDVRYISWIKKHGKGRVFYCSPSHNAQSYDNPILMQFMLDGFQYALGDLKCDDSPLKN